MLICRKTINGMKDFINHCTSFSPLELVAIDDLGDSIASRFYKKGEHLLSEGETCKYLYFINEGLVKVYSYKADKEFIMRFFAEDVIFSVYDSFINQTPSRYAIQAIEYTSITRIGYKDLMDLCRKHHCIETLFRIVTSQTAVRMTRRINEMLEENAHERYRIFLEENNAIIQRISLGDLARYLGITQPSLSRIRSSKQ